MLDKKLTLAFVTNNYTPYGGGIVSSLTALADGLRANGHLIKIITLDFLGDQQPAEDDVIRLECPVRFNYKTNPMAVPWRAKTQLKKILQDLAPDLIHTHHPFLLGFAAADIANTLKIPCVFTYHTQYEKYLHYIPAPEILTKPFIESRVKTYCNSVDLVIAPTPSIHQQLVERGVQTPIHIIPSSIDPFFFKHCAKKLNNNPLKLLTVSRFTPEKNIPWLLHTVAKLPRDAFHLTIIGYGFQKETLEKLAFEELNLINNVTFFERPEKNILRDAYHKADLFIFASESETQGLVLAESMACRTPIIALKAPGAQDIIEHEINGYLIESQEEMRMRIMMLHHNEEIMQKLRINVAQTANRYHPHTITQEVEKIYYSLLPKKKKMQVSE